MSIFENQEETNLEENNNNNNEAAASASNEIINKLMEIKRPDGTPKYTDPVAALDALKTSQEYIQKLESENAVYKEKAKEVETLQETLERLGRNMNDEKLNPQTKDEGGRSVEVAEELVTKLLEKKLKERDEQGLAIMNIKKVQDNLIKKFGGEDKAVEQIKSKAASLNTTPKALEELASQNPQLVLELFGSSATTPSPNNSSINLGGYSPPEEEIKAPEKSILSGPGATHKNQMEFFNKIKANVNKRLGVQT